MYSPAGLAALGVVGLWLAYLVPHRLRHRQQLLESRTEDRYSGSMRVLAVADRTATRERARTVRPASVSGTGLLTPARGTRTIVVRTTGGENMDRPHETHEQRSVDAARRIAQRHAQRAAVLARRSAAARRRLVLVLSLLALVAGAWTAVGAGALLGWIAVVPTLLLVATLALGRAAVVSAQRNDAAWERTEAQLQQAVRSAARRRPATTGRAVRGSEDETLVIDRVLPDTSTVRGQGPEDSWQPVPVPPPTYTLKAPAPRREPAPLEIPERAAPEPVAGSGSDESATVTPQPAAKESGGLDLDAILARRRAVGE